MKTKVFIMIIGLVFLGLVALSLRPVPIPDEKDCLILKGRVVEVYEAGVHDVVLKLQGDHRAFYVNRGLERGLELEQLKRTIMNKEVVIKYPKYWTPLDPNNAVRHISKIEYADHTIFTEVD